MLLNILAAIIHIQREQPFKFQDKVCITVLGLYCPTQKYCITFQIKQLYPIQNTFEIDFRSPEASTTRSSFPGYRKARTISNPSLSRFFAQIAVELVMVAAVVINKTQYMVPSYH